MWINIACFLASSILLVYLLVAQEVDFAERPFAKGSYLAWNFATTAVWMLEVGLRLYGTYREEATTREKHLWVWLEAVLAVVFLYDSIRLIDQWRLEDQDLEEDMLDVVMNVSARSG